MNRLPNKIIILLFSVLVLSTIIITNFSFMNNLRWDIKQEGSQVNVYLKGFSANKVIGADLNVFFDQNNLRVASVDSGRFFKDPIVIRSNSTDLSYSLMANPEIKVESDLSEPLFKFHLLPDKLSGYKFCILSSSQVYLSKIGGSLPKTLCRNLK